MRLALALLAAAVAGEAQAAAADIRFVACPIYRDTDAGRKSGCWLADEPASGVRYDVTDAPSKPDWNFEVLVEGRVSAKQDGACGGVRLDPVRTSVLESRCTRRMLPAEAFKGRQFVLPARNVAPLSQARTPPKPPFADRTFHILFDFNKAFLVYQLDDYMLDQAITYIRGVNPAQVIVTGHAATDAAEVSGHRLAEEPAIARERAELIGEALLRLGVPKDRLKVRWETGSRPVDAEGADGLAEASRRRVDLEVVLARRD